MTEFSRSLAKTLEFEGGYANHPDDPGGATMRGVTQAVYDAFRRDLRRPIRDVREIGDAEVDAIYFERYWLEARCEDIPSPLNALHFDAAVNHGVRRAVILLQRAIGAKDDGKFGPKTLAAVDEAPIDVAARQYVRERLAFFAYLGTVRRDGRFPYRTFMTGWLRRALALWAFAIDENPEVR